MRGLAWACVVACLAWPLRDPCVLRITHSVSRCSSCNCLRVLRAHVGRCASYVEFAIILRVRLFCVQLQKILALGASAKCCACQSLELDVLLQYPPLPFLANEELGVARWRMVSSVPYDFQTSITPVPKETGEIEKGREGYGGGGEEGGGEIPHFLSLNNSFFLAYRMEG